MQSKLNMIMMLGIRQTVINNVDHKGQEKCNGHYLVMYVHSHGNGHYLVMYVHSHGTVMIQCLCISEHVNHGMLMPYFE